MIIPNQVEHPKQIPINSQSSDRLRQVSDQPHGPAIGLLHSTPGRFSILNVPIELKIQRCLFDSANLLLSHSFL